MIKFTTKRKFFIFFIFTLLSASIVFIMSRKAKEVSTDKGRWFPLNTQVLESQIGLVGHIEAGRRLTLSAPFEGLVKNLDVQEGQRVGRLQHLADLDSTQLCIQIRQALAELLKARRGVQDMQHWTDSEDMSRARRSLTNSQLNVNDTRNKLADTRSLFERGIVARMELEAQEQQLKLQILDQEAAKSELASTLARGTGENREIADMELANAQSRYDILVGQQAKREIIAPFSGFILRPQKGDGSANLSAIHAGQLVTQGTPLFDLVSPEKIIAISRIEEGDLHLISEGMHVTITGDGFEGIALSGKVLSIGTQSLATQSIDSGGLFEVIVAIDPLTLDQQKNIRLGMSARLAVVISRKEDGLAVPAEALHKDMAGYYVVYNSTPDGPGKKVPVMVGDSFPQGVEITGIGPGYVIIDSNQ